MARPTRSASIVAVIVVACHAGCREPAPIPFKELPLEPPLKTMMIRLDTREMFVTLMPDVALDEVVDLGLFGPFVPGVPLDVVRRSLGEPLSSRRDHAGIYYRYAYRDTSIEIAHERSVSGGLSDDLVWEQWAVYAYPASHSTSVLTSSLVRLIDNERPSEVILAGSGDPRVSLAFSDGRLSMIRWYGVRTGDTRTHTP